MREQPHQNGSLWLHMVPQLQKWTKRVPWATGCPLCNNCAWGSTAPLQNVAGTTAPVTNLPWNPSLAPLSGPVALNGQNMRVGELYGSMMACCPEIHQWKWPKTVTFGTYVLLARTCEDVSMTSPVGPGYRQVMWMLTGMRTWRDTVAQHGRGQTAWRATWCNGGERVWRKHDVSGGTQVWQGDVATW